MTDSTYPDPTSLPFFKKFNEHLEHYTEHFEDSDYDLPEDMLPVEKIESILVPESGTLVWRKGQVQEVALRTNDYSLLTQLSGNSGYLNVTIDIIAAWLAGRRLGNPHFQKELCIELNDILSRDESICFPIQLIVEYVRDPHLTLDKQSVTAIQDPDYHLHWYLASRFDLIGFRTVQEKLDLLPFQVGSIVTVFNKSGHITESSPHGKVNSQYLGKVTDIDPINFTISIQNLHITGTVEDSHVDFLEISQHCRSKYLDLIKPSSPSTPRVYKLDDLGINFCMFDEPNLVVYPSRSLEELPCYVTSNGRVVAYSMNESELIYWCLKQRGIEFDEDLFFIENPQLDQGDTKWDNYGEIMSDQARKIIKSSYNSEDNYEHALQLLDFSLEQFDPDDFEDDDDEWY